jgi:hypothetical protein
MIRKGFLVSVRKAGGNKKDEEMKMPKSHVPWKEGSFHTYSHFASRVAKASTE